MKPTTALLPLLLACCHDPIFESNTRPANDTTTSGGSSSSTSTTTPTSSSAPPSTSTGPAETTTADASTSPADESSSSAGTSGETSTGASSTSRDTGDTESTDTTGEIIDPCPGFSLSWCPMARTMGQETRCDELEDDGLTCVGPWIRYAGDAQGVPAEHLGNDLDAWCQSLGYDSAADHIVGRRNCDAPAGRLYWCAEYDETAPHWCDFMDGFWRTDPALDFHQCDDAITSITCIL